MSRDEVIAMVKAAGGWEIDPRDYGPVSIAVGLTHEALERFAAMAAADADKWRQAIDHEMVIAHLGVANPDGDPAALLQEIIQWHVDIALDPLVSERARALVDGERETCAQIADVHAHGWKMNPGANPEAGFIASSNCAAAIRARSNQ